jgi:hypothetical protein
MVSVCASPSPMKGEEISGVARRGMIHHALRLGRTGGLGLCVRNSLESLFDKEGLREFGGSGG